MDNRNNNLSAWNVRNLQNVKTKIKMNKNNLFEKDLQILTWEAV